MTGKILFRRDTAANWTSANPTLAQGELALETDTKLTKMGDGINAWNALPYQAKGITTGTSAPAGLGTNDLWVDTSATGSGFVFGTAAGTVMDGADSRVVNAASLPTGARNGLTGWWHVDGFGAVGDDTTNDRIAFQNAIDACSTAGGGRVYMPRRNYLIGSSLTPKSGVTVQSDGGQIRISTSAPAINATTTSFTDFTLDGIVFTGTVNEFPTGPKRARTTSGAGMTCAVQLSGDLDVNNAGNAAMTNFTMRNCAVRNCSSLPILVRGLRGVVRVVNNEFSNNMDAGFTFNQEVIFSGNHVQMSADNGVSVSRGNQKVTVTGNTFENCCYWGIWVAGFNTDLGPKDFTVVGNTIRNVGYGGIIADAAASWGTIVGNTIDCGYNRGPSDSPTDSYGCGIYVGGYPIGSVAPSTQASNVLVGHNTIRTAPRAGIILISATSVKVSGNLIADTGTQYLADGTTAISSTDANNNVGILFLNSTTSQNCTVDNNTIIDERATPYTNYSIRPQTAPTNSNYVMNTAQGMRNTFELVEYVAAGAGARTFANTTVFSTNLKVSGGATAGSNTGGGPTTGFDVNGAAGNVRPVRWMTAGSERWRLYANGTAEGGSNVGSDLVLESKTDAAGTLNTLLTILRTGSVTLGVQGQPLTVKNRLVSGAASATIAAGANASAATAAGNGANDTAGTVNATVVASGATAGGALLTVTFATAYAATPHVVVTPQGSQSASCQPYVSARSTTGFTISSVNAPVASASLQYDYAVIG